ncbi:murein L,D-transpeptidase YcbB/YkuD [Dongia mobilis]|uniref:Murein L,D-transpeptidase YcbB/YkuD n=2 Tax=Dongia mobilis TaxID=578943 RepID=A0A4R6WWH1_9PROT|nr:murein L,D-transpeptidase YcbB/YkuD [Dongia mobilis]
MMRCTRMTSLIALVVVGTSFGATFAAAERDNDGFLQERSAGEATEVLPGPDAAPVAGIDEALTELARAPMFDPLPVDWPGLLNHYAENGNRALFTTPTGFTDLGLKLRARLAVAAKAGLKLSAEIAAALDQMPSPSDTASQARAEALLAAILVGTAVDATTILGDDDQRGAKVLADAATLDAKTYVDRQLPGYYRFWALLDRMPTHVARYQAGGWPEVPSVKKLEPGQSNPAVAVLRQRLTVTGELAPQDAQAPADPNLYDAKLVAAVETFQRNHGLLDDGIIGGRTLEELNVSAEKRLRQVLLNLERMREEGPVFEPRHLIANIPSQEVKVIEDGKVAFHTKAIFGRIERKSPTLSSVIHTVKLNPDWTAPYKIAAIDEVKRQRKDPNFLDSHGFTIYDSSGNVVSAQSINWFEVGPGNFPYTLRQAPGPENALGPVKFDFENDHAVFLHGTPTVSLFAKQDRYFSSGCVRTEKPIDLAEFMLQQTPDWDRARIDAVIKTGKTTLVKVANPLPVHITYMTAWVDEDGVMQFRKDAYGYDRLPALSAEVTVLLAMGQGEAPAAFNRD